VLERPGHTEAAVDFARLAGLPPVAITGEILAEDGGPARMDDCERFAAEHRIAMVSIEQLIEYRAAVDPMGSPVAPLLL
jgi:3,4-dihydroxy-2-butanone 4-phosphate synthase